MIEEIVAFNPHALLPLQTSASGVLKQQNQNPKTSKGTRSLSKPSQPYRQDLTFLNKQEMPFLSY